MKADNYMEDLWRYSLVARILHWLIAILIITLLALGWYMVSIEKRPDSAWYFNLHKSLGVLVLTLIVIRIAWRFTHKPQPLPRGVRFWEIKASFVIHWLLYAAMVLMPLTGFLGAILGKYGLSFFGIPLIKLAHPSPHISDQLFEVHEWLAWVVVVLVSIHVLGALKHLLIDRDTVFKRIWF